MELLTRGAFNRIADREGAIIVYPEGVDRHWNDGRDLPDTAARDNVDDVDFILALVEEVARQHELDRGRIFSTGISNGGFMSMRLACDAADTFAAVAPVTAVLSEKLGARCAPSRPVSIMIVNGTEDPLVPWAGGMVKVLGVSRGAVWSAERTFERWLELWTITTNEQFPEPIAAEFQRKARRVAESLKAGLLFDPARSTARPVSA